MGRKHKSLPFLLPPPHPPYISLPAEADKLKSTQMQQQRRNTLPSMPLPSCPRKQITSCAAPCRISGQTRFIQGRTGVPFCSFFVFWFRCFADFPSSVFSFQFYFAICSLFRRASMNFSACAKKRPNVRAFVPPLNLCGFSFCWASLLLLLRFFFRFVGLPR